MGEYWADKIQSTQTKETLMFSLLLQRWFPNEAQVNIDPSLSRNKHNCDRLTLCLSEINIFAQNGFSLKYVCMEM